MHALVTGASGFIGRRLVDALLQRNDSATVLIRSAAGASRTWDASPVRVHIGDLERPDSLAGLCEGVDTVFHLAGFAHAVDATAEEAGKRHERITVEGTRALIAEAVRAGVRKFVFVSTVKAMGEGGDVCLDESSTPHPTSAYGKAKLEAERLVLGAVEQRGWHGVILRLPMVYGPGNRGNLPRMIAAIDRGRFPSLPALANRRSMVHVDDVVLALLLAVDTPKAKGRIYIVTDGQAYSTDEIYRWIRMALGKGDALMPIPLSLLRGSACIGDLIGRLLSRDFFFNSSVLAKLTESAWYSSTRIRSELGFQSCYTLPDTLPGMIEEYRRTQAVRI